MIGRGKRLRENKHVFLVLYVPIYLASFFLVERLVPAGGDYWASYCPLDDLIPFVEWFIVPYCMWYPFLIVTGIYLMIKDVPEFRRYMFCIITGFTFCLVFYLLFPNGQDLRPTAFERDNVFVTLVRVIYAADTNTNVIPSMHVVGSIFAAAGICMTKTLKGKWIKAGAVILAALICFSTCFVKQHSLLDVFAGAALGAVVYAIIGMFMKTKFINS